MLKPLIAMFGVAAGNECVCADCREAGEGAMRLLSVCRRAGGSLPVLGSAALGTGRRVQGGCVAARLNEAYLLTVDPPCQDLRWAQKIGVTSTANSVSKRFDSVVVGKFKCRINEIRPIDYKKYLADKRRRRRRQNPEAQEHRG
ncbi:MAG: hypothetical protein IPP82_17030 [Xanthomonadales bacterium]|nr:hypothetical protein [Xanthomonadales bacterium]